MVISFGTYGNNTLESNSLVANMLKYPSISSTLVELWPQYTLSYFVERTERWATNVTYQDRRVQWFTGNRGRRPSYILSAAAPGGAATVTGPNTTWTINFDPNQNYVHPNDIIDLFGVNVFIKSMAANVATVQIHNQESTISLTMANIANIQCGVIGTAFAEGSAGGFGNAGYPDLNDNYMSIQKRAFDITGDAYTDVVWIEQNGQKLWYFKAMQTFMDEWAYEKEVKRWTGTRTVTATGAPTSFDSQNRPVYDGDGLFAQADSSLTDTYSGVLTKAQIDSHIQMMKQQGGITDGGTLLCYGGTAAQMAFHNALQNFYIPNGNVVQNVSGGQNVMLGNYFNAYYTMGVRVLFSLAPFFDDTSVFGSDMVTSSTYGGVYTRQSFTLFFVNASVMGGSSNLELAVKAAGGVNRANVIKYIPGMINPADPASMYAATSDDKFSVEVLSQTALILKNKKSASKLVLA